MRGTGCLRTPLNKTTPSGAGISSIGTREQLIYEVSERQENGPENHDCSRRPGDGAGLWALNCPGRAKSCRGEKIRTETLDGARDDKGRAFASAAPTSGPGLSVHCPTGENEGRRVAGQAHRLLLSRFGNGSRLPTQGRIIVGRLCKRRIKVRHLAQAPLELLCSLL
jgi:hypothetical protein